MTETEIAAIRRVLHRFDEDVIQDTLLALLRYPPKLERAKLTSYAFQVAKRIVYRRSRCTPQGQCSLEVLETDGALQPTQEGRAIARQQLERLWAIDPVIISDCYNQTKNHRQHRSTQLRHKNRVKEQ